MSANNQSESSISIEESNAIRLKLGLAPLTLTNEDEKTVIITSANTETDIPTEPKKKPNSRILIGKGLGAVSRKYDQQDLDALEWIQKSRNLKQKRPEKPRSTVQNGTYTNESLEGIRISHSMASFEDSAILTLKDSFIGAEDQTDADVLENIDLVDKDRVARNIELSKGKRYNAYEDGDPTAKSILSQYDTPEPENGFVIGHGGKVSTSAIADQKTDDDLMKKKMVSLEAAVPIQNLDYYTQAEMTFRKPRKVRRSRKKEAGVEAGFVEDEKFANSNTLTNIENVNFVDDDELQESLMDARRNARKGIVGVRIGYQDDDHSDDDGGDRIVISETSEFVDNLAMNSAVAQSEIEEDFELQSKDVLMSQEDLPALESNTDQVVKSGIIGVDDIVGQDDMQVTENIQEAVVAFQEPLVSTGMAATLALLKHQGILTSKVNDQTKDAMTSQRLKWQATQSRKILQAKLEADQKRQSNKQKGESGKRTQQIHVSAQETERLFLVSQQEKYKDYVPIVNLEYKDEYGRTQTPKEAFRELSHRFHGAKAGKKRTEKDLLKLSDSIRAQKMSSHVDSGEPGEVSGTIEHVLRRHEVSEAKVVGILVQNKPAILKPMAVAPSASRVSEPVIFDMSKTLPATDDTGFERTKIAFSMIANPGKRKGDLLTSTTRSKKP